MTDRHFALHDRDSGRTPHDDRAETCRQAVGLFVDRSTQQWVVRDPQGEFWRLGTTDSWGDRSPFELTDVADLQIVPGHYRYMLNLPF